MAAFEAVSAREQVASRRCVHAYRRPADAWRDQADAVACIAGHRAASARLAGAQLTPIHPRSSDSTLDTFFAVEISDPEEAARVLERLRNDPVVDAAYMKPDDELPSM